MELKLIPYQKNKYPISALLIKGEGVHYWFQEFMRMEINMRHVEVYPIPGLQANSIWGCLLITNGQLNADLAGKHLLCQVIHNVIYIPESADVLPNLSVRDIEILFKNKRHIFHPDFGLFELDQPLNFQELIKLPDSEQQLTIMPNIGYQPPSTINSFKVLLANDVNVLEALEKKVVPEKKSLSENKLSYKEKIKYKFYKLLFRRDKLNTESPKTTEKPAYKIWMQIGGLFNKKNKNWQEDAKNEFEALDDRSAKELDKLIRMLEKNPHEALKYALPINSTGAQRGTNIGTYRVSQIWKNLGLNQNHRTTGGSVSLEDLEIKKLYDQYVKTAELLIEQKKYEQAAFVYMKLLKNYYKAAQTLYEGKLFAEAAAIYLNYDKNPRQAAVCYEAGNMLNEAIQIHIKLKQYEKAGDLYIKLNQKKEAFVMYEKVVENYNASNQYIKSSIIYKDKMGNVEGAQKLLLSGWVNNADARNCLGMYLNNITEAEQLKAEISTISNKYLTENNISDYLFLLHTHYNKSDEIKSFIYNEAYRLVSKYVDYDPKLVKKLNEFKPADKVLNKDVLRYVLHNKKGSP